MLLDLNRMMVTGVSVGSTGRCLWFWYSMFGEDVLRLKLYVTKQGSSENLVWQKAGNRGDK